MRAYATLSLLVLAPLAPLLSFACTRTADLYDEPDGGGFTMAPSYDAGGLVELDAGLRSDASPACADRPIGPCQGPIDFPCDFDGFVILTADQCQAATGCKTNGDLEVKMAADGCVQALAMDEPNDDIVACLVAKFDAARCPCGASELVYSFGHGNAGCDGG